MGISAFLSPSDTLIDLRASDKTRLLQELSRRAADSLELPPERIVAEILKREELGSTGTGGGIAIPHGRLAGLDKPLGLFARLAHPVDFDSIDERPVDIVFLLVAPEGAGADHLKALARVSRLLRDRATCEKLRGSDTADALYAVLTETAASHAA